MLILKNHLILIYLSMLINFGITSTPIIFTISIPKCGTHLTKKCLSLMGLKKVSLSQNQSSFEKIEDKIQYFFNTYKANNPIYIIDNHFPYNHIKHTQEIENSLRNCQVIFSIRDPRDMIISAAYWIKNRPQSYPTISKFSIEQIILGLIDENYLLTLQADTTEGYQYHLKHFKKWIGWSKYKKAYTIKFENLIGPKGGGSAHLQKKELKNIALHCGIKITDRRLNYITKHLHGGSVTFRKGIIGAWKTHFTKEHKEAFKRNPEALQILVDLNYEKDFSWAD